MPAIYALLVGINGYPSKPLRGCVNDVNAVEEYLRKMYEGKPDVQLHIRRLTDQDEIPTRQNIIQAFDFYAPAANKDCCLFYYSGHGSFSKAPREFWTETDGFLESLVCIDSRTAGGRDLVDKEVGVLIAKTMAAKPEVSFIAITDCCHSGTITRAMSEGDVIERSFEASYMPQKLEDYYGFTDTLKIIPADPEKDTVKEVPAYLVETKSGGQKRVSVAQGRHIHLAAAQDNQTAKELQIDGMQRGAFTYSLLRALYGCQGLTTYLDLVKLVKLQVQNIVRSQDPLANANGGLTTADLQQYFLTSISSASKPLFTVFYKNNTGWCINAGSIHGVSEGDEVIIEGQPVLTIKEQHASEFSILEDQGRLTDHTQVYRATVKVQPNQKLKIAFAADINADVKRLMEAAYSKEPPAYVELVTNDTARYYIKSDRLRTFLGRPTDDSPLFNPVLVTDEPGAKEFLNRVNTISKWLNLQELNNPETTITNQHYQLTLYRNTTAGKYEDNDFEAVENREELVDFHYQFSNDKWNQPALKLQITNTSGQDLWFNCLYMGFDYAVAASLLKQARLPAGETTWLTIVDKVKKTESDVVKLNVEKKFLERGYQQIIEYLKFFISTKNIDLTHFEQEGIELADTRTRGGELAKGAGAEEEEATIKADDWKADIIGLRITKPETTKAITPGKETLLNDLSIEPHASLQAKFSISSSDETARTADSIVAPNKAYRNGALETFDLLPGTRSGTSSDVLELFGATNTDQVTEAQPLVIKLPANRLAADSSVMALGFDPATKLYYPVGYSNENNSIVVHTLPEETPSDAAITQRSFVGSIKIYFQKILGKAGLKYTYPRLAIAQVNGEGEVIYISEEVRVKEAVAKAGSILLCVHGIIGDTEGMARSVKPGTATQNLVLAFDYENLNTTIEENAALLKKRLAAVGLGEGHGKDLTIMAHSMGGLVSRWFIEKLGGNKVVSKLVMFGTPNKGTPWSDVRDMAETLLTFGLNGAAALQPWVFVLSLIGKLTKGAQVTLKQMDSETGIYGQLNDGTDPGIPYLLIAGNTREIIVKYEEKASAISKLLARLRKKGVYTALDATLFHKPNDIAVSVESMQMLAESEGWEMGFLMTEVASDHLNYFLTAPFVAGPGGFELQYTPSANQPEKTEALPPPPPPPPSPPPAISEEPKMPRPVPPKRGGGGSFQFTEKEVVDRGVSDNGNGGAITEEGQLEYDIPDQMKVGKANTCLVKIAGKEVAAALLKISDTSTHTDIRITEEMSVRLLDISGGEYFEVKTISTERQAILKNEPTTWIFRVKPLKAGKYSLVLKVTIHLNGRTKDLDVLEKDVLVSSEGTAGTETIPATANGPNRILFLCANPRDTVRLRTEAEARTIKEEILMSPQRDSILFSLNVAVTVRTLSRSLLQEKPTIVHFSGHGENMDGLCFETDNGTTQLVKATALEQLFKSLLFRPNCVLLNACYSLEQASVIVKHIPFVIGMNNTVEDRAARAFSIGFYQAIGAGYDVEAAFGVGLAGMALESDGQEKIPVLLKMAP